MINMDYYDILSGCDLGVFPSYYEPWGYTPLESAAHAVPTVTTELAGFGLWVRSRIGENKGVLILHRKGLPVQAVTGELAGIVQGLPDLDEREPGHPAGRREAHCARGELVRLFQELQPGA